MRKTKVSRQIVTKTLHYLFCGILSVIILLPMYIGVFGGLKSNGQLLIDPLGIPNPVYLANYGNIITGVVGKFWQSLMNSVIVAAGTVALTLVIAVMAAFAIARIKFRTASFFRTFFMMGLLFPLTVEMLPLYLQIRSLKLIDSYLGVIIPQAAFQIPMTVLLLIGFFKGIPKDLEDACAIDGYGPMGFLLKMVLPLSTPILATTSIIILVASWNSFFLPLLVFNTEKYFTLPMGVMTFQGQHAADWNMILSYLTLAMVPAIILFVTAQKYIVAGLTGGAVKG